MMALLLAVLLAVTGHTNPPIGYTAPNGTAALKVSDKLDERCSVANYPAATVAAQIATANTNCRRIYFPAGTYSFSTAITMPATFGRQWVGDGSQATTLTYTGTGPCGIVVDGSQSGGFEGMTINVTNTSGASAPVCFTDITGNVQRWHFIDVRLVGAQSPPIAGAYCLFMHSSTASGIAYNWGTGLTTINCDRGIEMLGDVGAGGTTSNWFFGYSANATPVGVYFDGTANDNYVQGHANGSGATFAQVAVVFGDGTHTTAGNEVHLVADNGPSGSVYNCQAGAVNNIIFAVKEGGGTNIANCGSTNHIFATSVDGVFSKNDLIPSALVGGTFGVASSSIFSSTVAVGRVQTNTTAGGGVAVLVSGTPSTKTVAVFTGARCVCTNTTTPANGVGCSVSSTTLTITGPNTVTDTVAYFCF